MAAGKAVIIGAGVGGLATAALLARSGWEVELYEARSMPGGRAGLKEAQGFRFDTGPSWYLMPEVYAHYFQLLGERVEDHLNLVKLTPAYKVFYDYRPPITITGDFATDRETFERVEPGSGASLERYLVKAERTYELAKRYFLYNPFTDKRTLAQPEVMRHSLELGRLLLQPLDGYVRGSVSSLPLQQVLEYPAVFLGTSPFDAPAMYHLMSYLDFRQGVYYPQGGLYEVVRALTTLAEQAGVRIVLDAPVDAIETAAGRTTGIRLQDGTRVAADVVISNADLHHTETTMVPEKDRSYPEAYWEKKTPGPSALLMYLGVKGKLPQLEHHNLMFVEKWRENFGAIFKTKTWPDQPSLYVCKPSATDKSVAPKGSENVFVLVPLPAGTYPESDTVQTYADKCLDLITDHCGIPDLKSRITHRELFGPKDFASELNAWQGTALGAAHILKQSAFYRPGNRSRKLSNLFYVGGDAQPGIGVPMCLISAELTYKHLSGDRSAGPLGALHQPERWHV